LRAVTAADTQASGHALGQTLARASDTLFVIGIEGELGAGKTMFVSGLLAAFGVTGPIRSPTYTLIEPYAAGERLIYHLDLYRLADARDVEALGVRDLVRSNAILLIEWPSRGAGALPPADIMIAIEYPMVGSTARQLTLRGLSAAGAAALRSMATVPS
jgi:tRNA threonylcarbamoyladenosine biosynthesis protein TsaE